MPAKKRSVIVSNKLGLPINSKLLGKKLEGFVEPQKILQLLRAMNIHEISRSKYIIRLHEFELAEYDYLYPIKNRPHSERVKDLIVLLNAARNYKPSLVAEIKYWRKDGNNNKRTKMLERQLAKFNGLMERAKSEAKTLIEADSQFFDKKKKDFISAHSEFLNQRNISNAEKLVQAIGKLKKSIYARLLEQALASRIKQGNELIDLYNAIIIIEENAASFISKNA